MLRSRSIRTQSQKTAQKPSTTHTTFPRVCLGDRRASLRAAAVGERDSSCTGDSFAGMVDVSKKNAASPATEVSLYVRCVLVRPSWRGDHRWVVQGVCSVAYPTMLGLMHALSNWFPRVVVARGLDQWAVSECLRGARSACAPMPWCCDGFLGLAFDWLVSVSRSFPQQAFL
jgi:hypothetical protein